ncbi:hypothetical protein GS429_12050 [Natronorubrum sp. JWXQ-INN-674]|uniref:Uncharacterized protein n=1 Tax=Natronorubrum halalkaliphilum TaxID=2691917 RepID=A0A6B0VMK8_9EURY|nr:hypothetical protein [Natronorubrum halalkaliphilum]MXV62784.1 hypothetical protein [Natronorubrum halalkaliphilum]
MSHLSSSRAQTEPIAALVAVLALSTGIGLYAVYIGGVLPGQSDRTAETTAIDRIWEDLEDEEHGVFPVPEYESGTDRQLREALDQDSLPDGKNVYIAITAYEDGEPTVYAAAHFDSEGDTLREQQLPSSHADFGPPRAAGEPDSTGIATRPISVEVTPADVRGGTLHVEVW